MRFEYRCIDTLPRPAWCACVTRGVETVRIFHGPWVETRADAYFECAWDGPLDAARFDRATTSAGTGARLSAAGVVFSTPTNCYEPLQLLRVRDRVLVSNSLTFLLTMAGDSAALDHPYYYDFLRLRRYGLRKKFVEIPSANGHRIVLFHYTNVAISLSLDLRWMDKEMPPAPKDYGEYVGRLDEAVGGVIRNATHHARRTPLVPCALLYRIVEEHYPAFVEHLSREGRTVPEYVHREFAGYLRCGRLEHGFLRVRCTDCHAETLVAFSCKGRGFCPSCCARRMVDSAALLVDEVLPHAPIRQWVLSFPFALHFLFARDPKAMGAVLGIVYRAIATHLIRKAGFTRSTADTGAVTVIQRAGSALNLNVHFHMLVLDGVYRPGDGVHSRRVGAPSTAELQGLLERIVERVARHLERRGLIVRDTESAHLAAESTDDDSLMDLLASHSVTYRIALGPHAGRKAFTLQSLPASPDPDDDGIARAAGFSLHAATAIGSTDRDRLERLVRYVARGPVAAERVSLTSKGLVRYRLKSPYRDGTTDVVFEPLDFIARLAALVPKPRVNLTRYHGVFAPNHRLREQVTPATRGPRSNPDRSPAERHQAMRWAHRLRRVFDIDVEACEHCGAPVKIIASIEDPHVIQRILDHLEQRDRQREIALHRARAPPPSAARA